MESKGEIWLDFKYIETLDMNGNEHVQETNCKSHFNPESDIKILIVGNSFSRDSLYYLRNIAQTKNVDITMGLLYMGGQDLTYHYRTKENNVNWFYINNFDYNSPPITQEISLKKVLTEYQWDIVVLQNYFDKKYTYVPDSSWFPVGADLAGYINTISPESEIMLNEIWSYELGYKYGQDYVDLQLQKDTDRYIFTKYRELAQDIERRINKKVKIVPVGQAIANARNYDTGHFSATYYKHGVCEVYNKYKHSEAANYDFQYGIISPEESEQGKIKMNRDGFHLSTVGRYLSSVVWFETLTGIDARTVHYIPPEEILGCWVCDDNVESGYYLFGSYCKPDKKYIDELNEIAHFTVERGEM